MKENITNIEIASLLYDFYGELLGDAQREVMMMYHEDNLSLQEIAEELGMSRQGVHYILKKAEKKLEEYEKRLGLIERYRRGQEKAIEIMALLEKKSAEGEVLSEKALKQVKSLLIDIVE